MAGATRPVAVDAQLFHAPPKESVERSAKVSERKPAPKRGKQQPLKEKKPVKQRKKPQPKEANQKLVWE